MRTPLRLGRLFKTSVATITLTIFCIVTLQAQTPSPAAATTRYFDSIRNSPPQLLAFLLQMPKGGELHNHLSGAIYAESYIQWAADSGDCINTTTMYASLPPCTTGQVPIANALGSGSLYRQIIDAWSMRNWQLSGQSGHVHFFDTFGKFGVATYNNTGKMIAEAAARGARGKVSYLELMLTPDGLAATQLGQKIGWDGDFAATLEKLKAGGIDAAV